MVPPSVFHHNSLSPPIPPLNCSDTTATPSFCLPESCCKGIEPLLSIFRLLSIIGAPYLPLLLPSILLLSQYHSTLVQLSLYCFCWTARSCLCLTLSTTLFLTGLCSPLDSSARVQGPLQIADQGTAQRQRPGHTITTNETEHLVWLR